MPYAAARALLLTLSLPLLLAATPATAGGWSVAPSGGGRPSFYAEGTPGAVLQDTLAVTNRGTGPLTVRLRATGDGLRVAFAEPALGIPARTRAEVPFTVTVPADAPPGDRAGRLLVRDSTGRESAVRLLIRVGGPELAALTVEHVAVRGDRITYELVNRGTTDLVPRLAVHADGVLGAVLDRAPRTLPVRLPPGRRLTLDEPWPDRPALDAVTVRLTVTAPGAARATGRASARFVPWGAAAGTAAGALSVTAAAVAVRRRGRGTATNRAAATGAPT
ncbi:hypothetical protein [Streptomyces zaehneri]|uniref:hypothetical protein n=1 Tax=Streptomyces zaehneri TaxID=3051180 RepID=UPI0028CFEB48|nr:hypothetical protein [Streptomyces sp. DSM 40713]